jgi:hypothetical protein
VKGRVSRGKAAQPAPSTGGREAALTPPAYGLEFVDQGTPARKLSRASNVPGNEEHELQHKFEAGVRAGAIQRKEPESVKADIPDPAAPVPGESAFTGKSAFTDESPEREALAARAKIARARIEQAIEASADTIELDAALQRIEAELGLKATELRDLGTPKAAAWFQINPWVGPMPLNNNIAWKMTGRGKPAETEVNWMAQELELKNPQGGTSPKAYVGSLMEASPLAPDSESGSLSTDDKTQATNQVALMQALVNSGDNGVPNDQKYVKGHLLNDNIGGPGTYFNLFPITADANAKHLAYVEKFIKAQRNQKAYLYYRVEAGWSNVGFASGKAFIDGGFKFKWYPLSVLGPQKYGPLSAKVHEGTVQSTYNSKGAEPLDVDNEYVGMYDKITKGKSTPKAILQPGQAHDPGAVLAEKKKTIGPLPTQSVSFPLPSGFGQSMTVAVTDLTGLKVKSDIAGLEYVSVRTSDAQLSTLAVGGPILVDGYSGPAKVQQISTVGGGWCRIYF